MTEATVHEFSGFGKRIKRATLKFAKCMQDAGTEFCKKYPDANPRTFRAHGELKAYLHESCGGRSMPITRRSRQTVRRRRRG